MSNPSVSIILPTYNRAYCLGRAIEAILNQSFREWKLIICDDCSPDETPKVADFYCNLDRRVCYLRNPQRLGLPGNRNRGIEAAAGRFIFFVEDDVVLEPDCLEKLFCGFNNLVEKGYKVGGIGPRTFEPPKKGKLLQLERQVSNRAQRRMKIPSLIDIWTGLMYQNFAFDCNVVMETALVPSWSLFDKEAIKAVGGYERSAYNRFNYSHEETDLFVRLTGSGYKLFFHPGAVAHHKHESRGGTRTSPLKYYYYYLGAHIVFLFRNYRWKASYMIPACMSFLALNVLRSSPALVFGKE